VFFGAWPQPGEEELVCFHSRLCLTQRATRRDRRRPEGGRGDRLGRPKSGVRRCNRPVDQHKATLPQPRIRPGRGCGAAYTPAGALAPLVSFAVGSIALTGSTCA